MRNPHALLLCLLCTTVSYGQSDGKVCFTTKEAEGIHDRLWAGDKAIRELEVCDQQVENRNLTITSLQEEASKTGQAAREASGKLGAAIAARQVSDDRVIELEGQVAVLDVRVGKRFRLGLGLGALAGAGTVYGLSRLK